MEKVRIEELVGREGMKRSAEEHGRRLSKRVCNRLLSVVYEIEDCIRDLEQIKQTQGQWYPYVGLTIEDLETLSMNIDKHVSVYRLKAQDQDLRK